MTDSESGPGPGPAGELGDTAVLYDPGSTEHGRRYTGLPSICPVVLSALRSPDARPRGPLSHVGVADGTQGGDTARVDPFENLKFGAKESLSAFLCDVV